MLDRVFNGVEAFVCREGANDDEEVRDAEYQPDLLDHIFEPVESAVCREASSFSNDSGVVAASVTKSVEELTTEKSAPVPAEISAEKETSPKEESKDDAKAVQSRDGSGGCFETKDEEITEDSKPKEDEAEESAAWKLAERSSGLIEEQPGKKAAGTQTSVILTYRPRSTSSSKQRKRAVRESQTSTLSSKKTVDTKSA